jgi:hypothetical protein
MPNLVVVADIVLLFLCIGAMTAVISHWGKTWGWRQLLFCVGVAMIAFVMLKYAFFHVVDQSAVSQRYEPQRPRSASQHGPPIVDKKQSQPLPVTQYTAPFPDPVIMVGNVTNFFAFKNQHAQYIIGLSTLPRTTVPGAGDLSETLSKMRNTVFLFPILHPRGKDGRSNPSYIASKEQKDIINAIKPAGMELNLDDQHTSGNYNSFANDPNCQNAVKDVLTALYNKKTLLWKLFGPSHAPDLDVLNNALENLSQTTPVFVHAMLYLCNKYPNRHSKTDVPPDPELHMTNLCQFAKSKCLNGPLQMAQIVHMVNVIHVVWLLWVGFTENVCVIVDSCGSVLLNGLVEKMNIPTLGTNCKVIPGNRLACGLDEVRGEHERK